MGMLERIPYLYRVLVIDDDEHVHEFMRREFDDHYELLSARDGSTGLRMLYNERPNLVILDLEIKKQNSDADGDEEIEQGAEICKRIREMSDVPIVVLTKEEDREVLAKMLDIGADDFVIKNEPNNVLRARLNATLRRVNLENQTEQHNYFYDDGELSINLIKRRVERDGNTVRLSPIEYRLLLSLLRSAPRPVPYQQLLEDIWGPNHAVSISYLRVYTWHLRKKVEADYANPQYIKNEPNVGYYFETKCVDV